ncbi:DUF4145 domain-containing protein [Plesiomonas shigelloides]|uniref:DUF4145 domain-containing protein n=1 Tax=Plesiomonas shigelloides TaxID=703 RepID=UPI003261361E
MASKEHWTCPYCNRDCTLGSDDIKYCQNNIWLSEDHGFIKGNFKFRICPNPVCRQISIDAHLFECDQYGNTGKLAHKWNLIPETNAKPFPDYIPQQLRDDYLESCLIKDKSPKASATLARRCLQGIIRDFWGVKKKNLFEEIAALEEKVDSTTWEAIDSVRKVGNIGAHMEKDVSIIIDVDPEEAGLLIWLIETLFEEWYIEKHTKEQKMRKIAEMAKEKSQMKLGKPHDQEQNS